MKSLFTIRRKRHAKHPQIIVDASKTKFKSVSLTHSKREKHSKYIPLMKNPNPEDNKQSYISKRIIEDFKFNYSKKFKNYSLTDEDINEIIIFLKSKQK